jgi:hypothetical protein
MRPGTAYGREPSSSSPFSTLQRLHLPPTNRPTASPILLAFFRRSCFTDADLDVLALCQRNCERNLRPCTESDSVVDENFAEWRTVKLTWGQDPLPSEVVPSGFDAVLATDVLYDIGLLPALLRTASTCLVRGGHFCLSHVPRACYNSKNPPVDDLEGYIVHQAERNGFELTATIRPRDCQQSTRIPSSALNYVHMCDLDQVGAAIFVFTSIKA